MVGSGWAGWHALVCQLVCPSMPVSGSVRGGEGSSPIGFLKTTVSQTGQADKDKARRLLQDKSAPEVGCQVACRATAAGLPMLGYPSLFCKAVVEGWPRFVA